MQVDWIRKMNAALAYIEGNLDGDIDVNEAGRLAGCSGYHFQRVFSYVANATVSEYIRRRRLTQAAFDLQTSEVKVIDVALRYGYDSPTSFTRAFSALHGLAPSKARQDGTTFVSYPPISFQISVQGVSAMNYRIEKKEAFRIIGPRLTTTLTNNQALEDIPRFWNSVETAGQIGQLVGLMNAEPKGVLGASIGDLLDGSDNFHYYIAVASDLPVPPEMHEYKVPASTWAIFESIGPMPETIQTLQKRIYTEWLPNSGYEYAQAPDIEVYSDGDLTANDYQSWVWLPVVKKGSGRS